MVGIPGRAASTTRRSAPPPIHLRQPAHVGPVHRIGNLSDSSSRRSLPAVHVTGAQGYAVVMSDTAVPSRPAVGDPAPDFTLPDDTGTERTPLRASAATGWCSTSIPRTTPPAAPPSPASSATPTRRTSGPARRSGASASWAVAPRPPSRPSSGCRSRSSPTRTTRSRRHTACGSRSRTTARPTWASRARRSSSIPQGASRRVWSKVKPDGHAAEVLGPSARWPLTGRRMRADDGRGHPPDTSRGIARGGRRAMPRPRSIHSRRYAPCASARHRP